MMLGFQPGPYFRACWMVLSPATMMVTTGLDGARIPGDLPLSQFALLTSQRTALVLLRPLGSSELTCFPPTPQALLVYNIIKYQPSEYGSYRFPAWAEALGILMGLCSCLMIPAGMLMAVLQEEGTLWEVGDPEAPRKCEQLILSPCPSCAVW